MKHTATYESRRRSSFFFLLILSATAVPLCPAIPSSGPHSIDAAAAKSDESTPHSIGWGVARAAGSGPAFSAKAITDPSYLPAQIAGIVTSYIVALMLVAAGLVALAKTRRRHQRKNEGLDVNTVELSSFHRPLAYDTYDLVGPRWGAK